LSEITTATSTSHKRPMNNHQQNSRFVIYLPFLMLWIVMHSLQRFHFSADRERQRRHNPFSAASTRRLRTGIPQRDFQACWRKRLR
jgi:hypothetical protein